MRRAVPTQPFYAEKGHAVAGTNLICQANGVFSVDSKDTLVFHAHPTKEDPFAPYVLSERYCAGYAPVQIMSRR